jgi:hypothetical protein
MRCRRVDDAGVMDAMDVRTAPLSRAPLMLRLRLKTVPADGPAAGEGRVPASAKPPADAL